LFRKPKSQDRWPQQCAALPAGNDRRVHDDGLAVNDADALRSERAQLARQAADFLQRVQHAPANALDFIGLVQLRAAIKLAEKKRAKNRQIFNDAFVFARRKIRQFGELHRTGKVAYFCFRRDMPLHVAPKCIPVNAELFRNIIQPTASHLRAFDPGAIRMAAYLTTRMAAIDPRHARRGSFDVGRAVLKMTGFCRSAHRTRLRTQRPEIEICFLPGVSHLYLSPRPSGATA
jgi:hypothetical protein